ncbi:GNAT family N-acetyltransferase [Bacillus salacetis]|uniref:GNAT family N-acetyltransferase n=1 Tax=Bacillus salacetis TaxID=2315464 RepID=A0A3A1R286_9BACI|nr:GNAT family N-acetyltransferase [Bacillus salacetis]RIW34622.1 GNAT family N-acetyltransferase [Bacillus salacetis]
MREKRQVVLNGMVLGDGISLLYPEPDKFLSCYSIYYGQKYSDYFFRRSLEAMKEIVSVYDCGYLIRKDESIIGGVFLKPNFMADLFVVPPYKDYEGLAQKLIPLLKKISRGEEKIILRDVVEEHVPVYESQGFTVQEVNYWMIRPAEPLKAELPESYMAKSVEYEDIEYLSMLIRNAYKANPAYAHIGTKEDYANHVKEFVEVFKSNEIMDESSRVIVERSTDRPVGVCLHMEFEEYPLIMSLAVAPEHQHRGLGRFLLIHSINTASRVYPATRLAVLKNNSAIKLYEDLGSVRNKGIVEMYMK